jgi:hypothetical protein
MTRYDTSNITIADLANHLRKVIFPKFGEMAAGYANVLSDENLIDAYSVAVLGKPIFMTPEQYQARANHTFTRH